MLTPEFGPTLEDPERDIELLTQAVCEFGQMQLDSSAHTDSLMPDDRLGFDLDQFDRSGPFILIRAHEQRGRAADTG